MKKIGLVGGISWASTIDYYRYINEGVNQRLGGLQFAECIIYSLNFGDVQEKTWENAFDLLLHAGNSLQKSGADALVLCANTAHLYADRLQQEIPLPLIHIVSETAKAVKKQGLKKLGVLGTKFTMEMDFYRSHLQANGLEVLVPAAQATRDYIQHTVKEELGRGIVKPETKQQYITIINELIAAGAEGIVLGCTEIPLLLGQEDIAVPVFDTTKIHAEAIVDYMLS